MVIAIPMEYISFTRAYAFKLVGVAYGLTAAQAAYFVVLAALNQMGNDQRLACDTSMAYVREAVGL